MVNEAEISRIQAGRLSPHKTIDKRSGTQTLQTRIQKLQNYLLLVINNGQGQLVLQDLVESLIYPSRWKPSLARP